jgi:Na+/phosphate symporter
VQADFEVINKIIVDGEAAGDTHEKISYNIDQTLRAGTVFTASGVCAAGWAGALETGLVSALATIGACLETLKATKEAIDAANKEASDRAERETLERDFNRARDGGDGTAMAGEPKGFDGDRMHA